MDDKEITKPKATKAKSAKKVKSEVVDAEIVSKKATTPKYEKLPDFSTASKYAVVTINGEQHIIVEGETIQVNRVQEADLKNLFKTLMFVDGDNVMVGKPELSQVEVKLSYVDEFKDKKVRSLTYKSKSRYRRIKGSRATKTNLKVEKISVK